ncbi:uncharacterized protein N7483_002028 [Penicillium malachiteum]|uniref:uncharacterized protein n=1 Tax=Penicillium malachiteum TaxID=1324776 RepID=UPI002546F1A2|nr:uncharacterized protein N7483_002028 [Penicillium malachiteum]KAJ5736903.1 hypothetical protein N7483_002028 [Penicillium malachiteum]
MYFPNHSLVERAFLFFQWDYIIINLVIITHGAYIFQYASGVRARSADSFQRYMMKVVALVVILGPGAGLAFVMGRTKPRH